jgi:hypothetical protein
MGTIQGVHGATRERLALGSSERLMAEGSLSSPEVVPSMVAAAALIPSKWGCVGGECLRRPVFGLLKQSLKILGQLSSSKLKSVAGLRIRDDRSNPPQHPR